MIVFWLILAMSLAPWQQWALPPRADGQTPMLWRHPLFLTWFALLALAQGVLLVRVRPGGERPEARRKLWPAIIAAAFCLGLLTAALVITLSMATLGDEAFGGVQSAAKAIDKTIPVANADGWLPPLLFFGFIGGMWAGWWIVLGPVARNAIPESLPARFLNWILTGSVLELLVAVPCHIICRRREDCCAPILTFWGMATGWALLLLSLGPAVGLLIERRIARKRNERLKSECGQPEGQNAQSMESTGSTNR